MSFESNSRAKYLPCSSSSLCPRVAGPFLGTPQMPSGSKTALLAERAWFLSRLHNACRSWVRSTQLHCCLALLGRQAEPGGSSTVTAAALSQLSKMLKATRLLLHQAALSGAERLLFCYSSGIKGPKYLLLLRSGPWSSPVPVCPWFAWSWDGRLMGSLS